MFLLFVIFSTCFVFCYYFSFSLFRNVKISLILLLPLSSLSIFWSLFLCSFFFLLSLLLVLLWLLLLLLFWLCFFFFLLLVKQLFSHETVKVSRLFVYLFVLFLWGNNTKFHYFFPVRKRFTIFFIYFHLNIILHFILNFSLFFTTRFIVNLL